MCPAFVVVGLLGLVTTRQPAAAISGGITTIDLFSNAGRYQSNGSAEIFVVNSGPSTLPNPAAVFCIENGGKYEIRKATDGSQSGVCILSDGREVDAWQFFRQNTKIK
jgi:putative hemolysin